MSKETPKFYQLWSVWATTLIGIISALEPFFPTIHSALPPGWQAGGAVVILILRAIKQGPPSAPPGAGSAVGLAMLFIAGCAAAQPDPEREKCYAKARAAFHTESLTTCTKNTTCTDKCADKCGDDEPCIEACESPCIDACVDRLTPGEKTAQEACP